MILKYINQCELTNGDILNVIEISPLLNGRGTSLGNWIRRELLQENTKSSISGFSISDISNEFQNNKNLKEDTIEIIENLKNINLLNLDLNNKNQNLLINKTIQGPRAVYISDLQLPSHILPTKNNYLFSIVNDNKININFLITNNIKNLNTNLSKLIILDNSNVHIKNINFKINLIYDSFGNIKEKLTLNIITSKHINIKKLLLNIFYNSINLFFNLLQNI